MRALHRIDVLLDPGEVAAALRAEVADGLGRSPKELSPKWFYDDLGCALFEAITRLPEYYLTRAERALLAAHAADIADLSGADTLVELGSGTSDKTRLVLDALADRGRLRRFVPFDVSETTLRAACAAIGARYPDVEVHAVVGDFHRHLDAVPSDGARMTAFLGSTIGNLYPEERTRLLGSLAGAMRAGDSLLIGVDLVKSRQRLEAAYDDAAGVTAAFNRNILAVINRGLGADFDLLAFDHVARWDADNEWIEMTLRARSAITVRIPGAAMTASFGAGEEMRTEISTKFRRLAVDHDLSSAGLTPAAWFSDARGDFALVLARKQ